MYQQSKVLQEKDEDILKLKNNLEHALKLAVNEAVTCTKAKQQSMRQTQTKIYIEKKYIQATEQLNEEKMQKMKMESTLIGLQGELNREKQQKRKVQQRHESASKQLEKTRSDLMKISSLQLKISQIDPLKNRIKGLEMTVRSQKLKQEEIQKMNKQLNKTIQELHEKLKQTKPFQEQLLQRIAFLERVNLELERKMEDFHRREHDYKKQVAHYKSSLAKMTTDRNKYKKDYENTYATLQQKLEQIQNLNKTVEGKNNQIKNLTEKLNHKSKESEDFAHKLQQTIDFYQGVALQNLELKKKMQFLQQNEQQMRRVIAEHIKIAEETNLYIISRNSEILKLDDQKSSLLINIDALEKKFIKLDKLFEQNSARGQNEIKQSYYATLKQRNKFALQIKDAKEQLSSKILQFGEQRDIFNRKIQSYFPPTPSEQTIYESIIADKIQLIVMLQSSNDQLLKIKKQQQDRVAFLQSEAEVAKKQMYNLRLKAAELFKMKRDLQEAKARSERYLQMIEQQRVQISDMNSQMDILRQKSTQASQKLYNLSMENKNLSIKISELESVMKQLDIQYLKAKKLQNQKNAHLITDSLEKLNSGINSLSYYFSCCFCNEMLNNPVTLAACGHNYCTKCKDAYSQYCYECDTGQEIQRIYSSKYLKETAGKYRFLTMVLKQANNNLMKINI